MRHIASGILIITLFSGCLPDLPTYIDELDLVYTNYSPSFHWTEQRTYAIPDSVVKLTGNLAEGEAPEMVGQPYGNRIIQDLRDNMDRNGWTEVAVGDEPDVVLLPIVNTSTTVNFYYAWDYWGWYYPSWGYGWGWYYPGYYPTTVSTYSTGTLMVSMAYPAGRGDNDYVPVEWLMLVDGLLEGSSTELLDRIDDNIDQAFTQSPYLKIQ